jgi:hypothetical protein
MTADPHDPTQAPAEAQAVAPHDASDGAFSTELERWLQGDGPKSVGSMSDIFAEKGFAVAILLLMFVPALPLPTGGITHVFEAITVLLSFEMILGRETIWLPRRWRDRELGSVMTGKAIPFVIRRVRFFERHSRPRLPQLFRMRSFLRVIGLLVLASTLGSAVAPPFSGLDTLPALGAVMIALSIILEDAVLLALGCLVSAAGVLLIITIGAAAARFLRGLF